MAGEETGKADERGLTLKKLNWLRCLTACYFCKVGNSVLHLFCVIYRLCTSK